MGWNGDSSGSCNKKIFTNVIIILINMCSFYSLDLTYPNVSSCFCRNQISFVKYEVCMVEDDHGESGPCVGGGAVLARTLAPPPPPSPDSILTLSIQ